MVIRMRPSCSGDRNLVPGNRARRWLYLETFTLHDPMGSVPPSDAIGYGFTSSAAIRRELSSRGVELLVPQLPVIPASSIRYQSARWISEMYGQITEYVYQYRPDVVFAFHIFVTFPTVIRKVLQDLGHTIPILGYTHGSHWDETDLFRVERYPGLELLDVANMHVLDRLLLVSEYMRNTLRKNIGAFNHELAENILAKTAVVGLPIDTTLIERYRTTDRFQRTTIVFNHAPITSKGPDLFARVMNSVLEHHDVNVLMTRRFTAESPGMGGITALIRRFGDRVILGNDMPIADYYRALWMSDIQVSTATHESLGIATLEAMYTKNCCVLPRLGAYPEICHGNSQILYDLGEQQLADRIAYYVHHPAESRDVAEWLSQIALRYEPARVVDRILRTVAEL